MRTLAETAARRRSAILLVAVVLTALNLRTAVTSAGPLLEEIRGAVALSSVAAGLLTSLPVLSFAAIGAVAPAVARRAGTQTTLAMALGAMTAGLLLRAVADGAVTFLAFTVLALVGGAMGNVLLPVLVKQHFAHRLGALTAAYTTSIALGATLAAAVAVPVADAATARGAGADGWRYGVGVWALPAAAAGLVWAALLVWRSRVPAAAVSAAPPEVTPDGHPARTRTGWALALFFGTQALAAYVAMGWFAQFYRDAGVPAQTAGYLVAFLSALSIPMSMVVPALAARSRSQRPLVVVLGACYVGGYSGMLLAPTAGAWVWAFLVGVGMGCFPLALTLIGLRSSTPREAASLSAFTQSTGYVVAAAGPLLVGWLHGTGGWAGSFAVLFIALAIQLWSGWVAGAPAPRPPR